jgi:3-oxoacyl-[acyl-carrier protein] reductase
MNLDLRNKNAIVCGSTQGLGKASAIELALLGANVTLVARNETSLQKAILDLDTSLGQQHRYFVADFSNPQQVKAGRATFSTISRGTYSSNNTGGLKGSNPRSND